MTEEKEIKEEREKPEVEKKPKAKSGPNVIVIIISLLAFQALVVFLSIELLIPKDDFNADLLRNPDDITAIDETVLFNGLEGEVVLPIRADVVVNIAGTDGSRFLKVVISVAYDSKDPNNRNIAPGLAKIETQLRSKINEYLSSLTLSQVSDRAAIASIRAALLPELNALIPSNVGRLSNVYIEEFIIQ